MQDVEIIGLLKTYINKTLVGMGALKGAPCTVKSVEENPGVHVITLEWTDNDGNKQTKEITVLDGTDGTDGTDGFSPKVTVKTSTDSTYILTITTIDGSYDTPNLKGGGSGGASKLSDLSDVDLTDIEVGDVLVYQEEIVEGQTVGVWVVTRPLTSVSVNGVEQTITDGAVNLDIANNLITEAQWTAINGLYA